ncbi:2-phosphosulfolactate phosphatase [Bacillus sp. T33-2]|uniref:2-phosphosulfolactate phosphatase n=1 Tax=Bacillus sp. T33-2 TaxID=2054168 RepID=UPI000C784237|nr:2-phosphosulfolactate phosphatase [Bacillus sp. T33-2]PLR96828.1 2-phosphosulfolactate phosphatase [Bacillus sp. T33-2]
MEINIYQGYDHRLAHAHVNVIIDVIRAFTVAHQAFLHGARKIILTGTVEEAFRLKAENPEYLLAGEIKGLQIPGFDLDNSPKRVADFELNERVIVQKTTNGVKAALNSLDAEDVIVTGFSNARATAEYIRKKYSHSRKGFTVNIVASHPTGDDDLACAEYIKGFIHGTSSATASETADRILKCEAAGKFFDEAQPEFDPRDIFYCIKEIDSGFVMKVYSEGATPEIRKVYV